MQSGTDGLPKQFVSAMRTLFEVMDERGSGYVRLSDLEQLWREERTQGVPKGVIASLRKVAPPSGMLTFDRFCAGLQMCLLHCQGEVAKSGQKDGPSRPGPQVRDETRPPSAPLLDVEEERPVTSAAPPLIPRGNQQRAVSLPQLSGDAKTDRRSGIGGQGVLPPSADLRNYRSEVKLSNGHRVKSMAVCGPFGMPGPPKPPRASNHRNLNPQPSEPSLGRAEIRSALQNWQRGLMQNEGGDSKGRDMRPPAHPPPPPPPPIYPPPPTQGRGYADGKPEAPGLDAQQQQQQQTKQQQQQQQQKRSAGRRREPRRHTVQNGIDYSMLKRLKQLEQEKDILLQGLQAVERARDWYLQQISTTQDKMKYLGKDGGLAESSLEAAQERLNFQMARILEVNQLLQGLACNSSRRFPLHMNLAVPAWGRPLDPPPYPWGGNSRGGGAGVSNDSRSVERLKDQNRLLTEEVGRQSERVTDLQREKAALIRELFQARSKNLRGSVGQTGGSGGGGGGGGGGWPESGNETVFM